MRRTRLLSAGCLLWLLSAASRAAATNKTVWVTRDAATERYSVQETAPAAGAWLARASVSDQREQSGWSQLLVEAPAATADQEQAAAFAAGLAEAHLTSHLISDFHHNVIAPLCQQDEQSSKRCQAVDKFLEKNVEWARDRGARAGDDPFWRQVALVLSQLDGLQQGITDTLPDASNLTALWLQAHDEVADVMAALEDPPPAAAPPAAGAALVRLTNDSQLLVGHATWRPYSHMTRVLKRYQLPFAGQAAAMAFSGYPGALSSQDDFWLTSAGLVIVGTRLPQLNAELSQFVRPGSLLTWLRAAVAARLAESGQQWHAAFSRHHSGTGNGQWTVVQPARLADAAGLLWTTEQMPGLVVGDDVSQVLLHERYWAGYSLPYFPIIDDISGVAAARAAAADPAAAALYSHRSCPQAQIFRRDQAAVQDAAAALQLMRYNNYTEDPLSAGSAAAAPAPRHDLSPAAARQMYGAIDAKVTSAQLVGDGLQFWAEAGPTHAQLPAFQWTAAQQAAHRGQPDVWNFQPMRVTWNL